MAVDNTAELMVSIFLTHNDRACNHSEINQPDIIHNRNSDKNITCGTVINIFAALANGFIAAVAMRIVKITLTVTFFAEKSFTMYRAIVHIKNRALCTAQVADMLRIFF